MEIRMENITHLLYKIIRITHCTPISVVTIFEL